MSNRREEGEGDRVEGGRGGAAIDGRPAHAHSLPVDKFQYDHDDFDEWVDLFEDAVGLAHGVGAGPARNQLCIRWLPLKLDKTTRTIYENCTKASWPEIRAELSTLFVDPQDKYSWLAGRRKVVWDGKESFHSLASRVKKSVDKYDSDGPKAREYFLKFRLALTPEYRKAIDIGCGDTWNIDEAKKVANRLRLAEGDAAAEGPSGADRAVGFTGAAMSDDRLKAMELSLQGINVKMDNLDTDVRKMKEEREGRSRNSSSGRDSYDSRFQERRSQSRGRDGGRYSRDGSRDGRGRRDDRYRAFNDQQYSQNRSRRDSYERRDYGRRDDYGNRSRQPSYDQRSSGSSRDRQFSRDRFSRERYGRDRGSWDRERGRQWDNRDRRPDSRDRWGDRDRWGGRYRQDSRDRGLDRDRDRRDQDQGAGRPPYYRQPNRPQDNRQQDNRQPDNRPPDNRREEGNYRSAEFDAQMEYLAAALNEKQIRDSQQEN